MWRGVECHGVMSLAGFLYVMPLLAEERVCRAGVALCALWGRWAVCRQGRSAVSPAASQGHVGASACLGRSNTHVCGLLCCGTRMSTATCGL